MKRIYHVVLLLSGLLGLTLPLTAKADIFHLMGNLLKQQLNMLEQQTGLQQDIKGINQLSLQQLQGQLAALTGNRGYGSVMSDSSLQSWGQNTQDWQKVLLSYQSSGSMGELNGLAHQLNQQFPVNARLIQQNTPQDSSSAKYYTLQAETTLAARAASEYSFNQVSKQIQYQQQLQQQIDHTVNVKDAIDLQNRLQVENNLLQLQLLRLHAMSNQQQAVQAQGASQAAVTNTQFLLH